MSYKKLKSTGYRAITVEGRLVWEHRNTYEQHWGISLQPGDYVKHKDGNTLNNDINNLILDLRQERSDD